MYSKAEELSEEFGYWAEHPKYSISAWKYEVENNDTRNGYWDWVANCIENDEPEFDDAPC